MPEQEIVVSDPIQEALTKRAKLQAEIDIIDRYLDLHRQIFGEIKTTVLVGDRVEAEVIPAEKREKAQPLNDPDAIVEAMRSILSIADEPMTRGQLRSALSSRGIIVHSKDVSKYLGTLLWRNKNHFINIEGQGYWLTSRTFPESLSDKDQLFQ
jgi:hypothetical protein